jgi:hypothetical protein
MPNAILLSDQVQAPRDYTGVVSVVVIRTPQSPPYAIYYNYHRLHRGPGWPTPAERFEGTPRVDPGFEYFPSSAAIASFLAELLPA